MLYLKPCCLYHKISTQRNDHANIQCMISVACACSGLSKFFYGPPGIGPTWLISAGLLQLCTVEQSCNKNITWLQGMQNYLAQVRGLLWAPQLNSFEMLRHLCWLSVQKRINFILAKLVFNLRNGVAPGRLNCFIKQHVPSRSL